MFAVTYEEGACPADSKDLFICYVSALHHGCFLLHYGLLSFCNAFAALLHYGLQSFCNAFAVILHYGLQSYCNAFAAPLHYGLQSHCNAFAAPLQKECTVFAVVRC
jgi:hypothetical protein